MEATGPRLSGAASVVRHSVFASLQTRIDAFRARGGDLIPLQIGDTFLPPPRPALEALRTAEAVDLGVYGAVPGLGELRSALAERLAERDHRTVSAPTQVHVGAGATHALFCAARAVLDPGDEVLVVTPFWPLAPGVFATASAVPVEVPLTQELHAGRLASLRGALEAAATTRTRGLYFSTPGNPDGYVFSARELSELAAFAAERDLWVFSDEVYADFVYEGTHTPFANLDGAAHRTVTCHSLSKSHALAGARVGYVSGPERVVDAIRRIANHTVYNVPVPLQRAALAAVREGDGHLREAQGLYRLARDRAVEALARHGIAHHVPRGGSFVFADLGPRLDGRPLQRALELAVDHGVLVAPGDAFGRAHAANARLCFTGVPADVVVRGIDRLAAALQALVRESPPPPHAPETAP